MLGNLIKFLYSGEPKKLWHLCILSVREHLGKLHGWNKITEKIEMVSRNPTLVLPARIIELLNFQQVFRFDYLFCLNYIIDLY